MYAGDVLWEGQGGGARGGDLWTWPGLPTGVENRPGPHLYMGVYEHPLY